MKKILSFGLFLVTTIFFSTLTLTVTGCEKEVIKEIHDTTTITVHDTTYITIVATPNIIVDGIVQSPDSISVGGQLELTVQTSVEEGVGELSYLWFTSHGSFNTNSNDTVIWTAPDDAGTYTVYVHVTDNESDSISVGVGKLNIGVGMYVATLNPYFVGESECSSCHSDVHTAWTGTGHSGAWESLMANSYNAPYCYKCHSTGYFNTSVGADSLGGDAGYDEAPIAKYENVQCENCHGPGSEHIQTTSSDDIYTSWDVNTCGNCHNGTHYPYLDEWEASPHNFDPEASYAGGNSYCQGCHEGVAAAYRLAEGSTDFYGSGAIEARPPVEEVPLGAINCQTCHDSHSHENNGQLRTVADVTLVENNGESPVITDGGSGKLCMQCHHARRGPDTQLADGYGHFGPHASPQADVLAGKSVYFGVADESFTWAGESHLNVQNSCKTCHLNTIEYDGTAAVTGHTFNATVESCAGCHGAITDFADIMATDDYDGDDVVEGLQLEVMGLISALETALIDSFLAAGIDTSGDFDLIHELGIVTHYLDPSDSTLTFDVPLLWRESGYNLAYVESDKSHGIHNPDFIVQILQQSYLHLTNTLPGNARIITRGSKASAVF